LATPNIVEHWQRIGPRLEEIRRRELRELDVYRDHEAIDALLQMAFEHGVERKTSGLVEFQRKLKAVYTRRESHP
jgi:hypothetical protein